MTLVISWVRKISDNCEELLVASDSRLNGSRNLDVCPKILTLPRSDSFICFAGDTDFAYPLMNQLSLSIASYSPSRDRAMDIEILKGYLIKVFNSMRDSVNNYVDGQQHPEVSFILGGYSWIHKEFILWLIQYKKSEKKFVFKKARNWIGGFQKILFAGDKSHEANKRLITLLQKKYNMKHNSSDGNGFNMEPFEVLRDMLRESNSKSTIGGAPQLVKVYQHMNCRPICVYWPNRESNKIFLNGRQLFEFEHSDYWILDPDKLTTSHPVYSGSEEEPLV